MNLTRFEPWSVVDLLHRDLDRIAGRRFAQENGEQSVADWVPAVDIVEQKDRFVLHADVPGVDPSDIDIFGNALPGGQVADRQTGIDHRRGGVAQEGVLRDGSLCRRARGGGRAGGRGEGDGRGR